MNAQADYNGFFSFVYEAGSRLTLHRRYIRQFFSQVNLGITEKTKVLDAGCGGGRFALSLLEDLKKRNIEIIIDAFDKSEHMLRKAERCARRKKSEQNINLYQADGANLSYAREFKDGKISGATTSFADSLYDIVLCSGMLECIPQECVETAIDELVRVLKPNGLFVLSFVKDNGLGKIASEMLKFTLIDIGRVMKQFYEHGIQNFEEFHVRSHHPYLKELTGIYIGRKLPDECLKAEVQQSLNKQEESVRL